jgi:hypothetical protein
MKLYISHELGVNPYSGEQRLPTPLFSIYELSQGISNCGTPLWYTGLVRKDRRIKKIKISAINAVT